MTKHSKSKPPLLLRDRQFEYDPDVPSREALLAFFRSQKGVQTSAQLIEHFGLKKAKTLEAVKRRLNTMCTDGQLHETARGWRMGDERDIVQGTVLAKEGFGFLIPDDRDCPDVYLGGREMQGVMHGDRVRVKIINLNRRYKRPGANSKKVARETQSERLEGVVVEMLERAYQRVVGRLVHEYGQYMVVPEDQRLQHGIYLQASDLGGAKVGQVVVAELLSPPTKYLHATGKIIKVLGRPDDPGIEIDIAIHKFQLPAQFSDEALKQAARLPDTVPEADYASRIDLRDVPFFTIDGEDARDFDDAVYAEWLPEEQAWRLLVAIADVSHYVTPDSPLDVDAYERSTSVYFPRRVLPMLPEKLSNGLCSLNPKVDRLVMVCDMVIDTQGKQAGQVSAYQFYNAVIHSHARTTYNEVWAALQGDHVERHLRPVMGTIRDLYRLYECLEEASERRGAMKFETTETQIVLGDEGKIENILPRVRNAAHKLIEQCMLAANTCAAHFIDLKKKQSLYRIHEGPTPDKLLQLRDYLKAYGLRLEGGDSPCPRDYEQLLDQVRTRPDFEVIQTMCLRSMQQAVYSPHNMGHFGLAYPYYTHFTSPIRRYPDLLVHRTIKAILARKTYKPSMVALKREKWETVQAHQNALWEAIGTHCSVQERRADEASKDVLQWLKCVYTREHVGEIYSGRISSVTSFGVFVQLTDLYVEGLVHISQLEGDYFHFDETLCELQGERTGMRYRTGQVLNVQIAQVNVDSRRIDFTLAPSLVRPAPTQRKNKKPAKAKSAKVSKARQARGKGHKDSRSKRRHTIDFEWGDD